MVIQKSDIAPSSVQSFIVLACSDCHCRPENPMIVLKAESRSFMPSRANLLPSMNLSSSDCGGTPGIFDTEEPSVFLISASSRHERRHNCFGFTLRTNRMPPEYMISRPTAPREYARYATMSIPSRTLVVEQALCQSSSSCELFSFTIMSGTT